MSGMCTGVCIDMCTGKYVDMYTDVCLYRHEY